MSESRLTESNISNLLAWAYEKSVNGIPGTETAYQLADNYMAICNSEDEAIDELIFWQKTKSVTSGFLTGLGGFITLPVAIPANIASVMYVQLRMVAAIAHMRGYDLKSDQVKTFVFVCLTGQSTSDVLKQAGIKIGTKMTKQAIQRIPGKTVFAINKAVGFRLVTKFGSKGAINLGKALPLVGGIIGGAVDGIGTNVIGQTAKKMFI